MTGGTHYDTLGVPPDATAAEIREAFVRLAEVQGHGGAERKEGRQEAEAALARLRKAYHVLADPRRRAEHDWRLGIDDLQPLDWGGALPEPHPVEPSVSRPPHRRLSPLVWLRALGRP